VDIKGISLRKEYLELIMEEVNVKKVNLIKSEKLEIKFDAKITKELEQEGYAREITRLIQNLRKEMSLKKQDVINVNIEADYDFGKFLKNIKEKVGAKTLEMKPAKSCKKSIEKTIKDKNFKIFVS